MQCSEEGPTVYTCKGIPLFGAINTWNKVHIIICTTAHMQAGVVYFSICYLHNASLFSPFIFLETTKFVELLFRSLENESYLRGDDGTSPASPKKPKVGGLDTPVEMHGELSPRSALRKLSEDVRHREVNILSVQVVLL